MSLLYWWPFTKDGSNQGLRQTDDLPITINNNGKIGKCALLTSSTSLQILSTSPDIDIYTQTDSELSYAFWLKIDSEYLNSYIASATFTDTKKSINNCIIGFNGSTSSIGFCLYCRANDLTNSSIITSVPVVMGLRHSSSNNLITLDQLTLDTWHHIVLTYSGTIMKGYIDGEYKNSKSIARNALASTKTLVLNSGSFFAETSNNFFNISLKEYFNDVRIYNHALSPKEVKEISKGLVLHYKLDKNLSVLNNCYSNPTFNTSSSNGGWNHWGPSGHAGKYSQNTDSQYIYNKANTYSHCVDNTASATGKYYLCYKSPSFSGGYRSLQFIVKEANGLPITEAICYPGWNARDGGAPRNIWSEIIDLSNGFYLCKVNGLSQDGSDDLVSIAVQPGYKIYISEGYLENDKEICSDIFNQENLTNIYDCSGYGNDGTVIGSLTAAADSPRYKLATVFNGTDSAIKVTNNNWCSQGMEALTVNLWAKASSWSAKKLFSCTDSGGFNTESGSSGYLRFPVHVYTDAEKTSTAYKYDSKEIKISDLSTTDWVMITFVYDTTGTKTYINGELHHTYENTSYGIHFNMNTRLFLGCEANAANPSTPYLDGQESDFRIYATALSAAAIKELYDTSASIDASGNMYARELVE